jgi:adenine phosphoribosyltransferase
MALALGVGVIPVRKPGKLPADTIAHEYDLEYGSDRLEMHRGILAPAARVLVVDDVLATGGTARACARLVEVAGATVVGMAFLVELAFLGGRERLAPHRVESLLVYP